MHHVQLSDLLYEKAKLRAKEAGFSDVDAFIAEVLEADLSEEAADFDHLFTPERLAHLDRISAEVKAGAKTYTPEEVRAHFRKKHDAWPASPAN